MRAPKHCTERKFMLKDYGNVVCIDTILCYWYCPSQCQEFVDYCKRRKEEKVRRFKLERKEKKITMAARAELIQICEELGIDSEDMSIEGLTIAIRKKADKMFVKKKKVSADTMSAALKKFLTKEYDFVIKDKGGVEIDHKGNKAKE